VNAVSPRTRSRRELRSYTPAGRRSRSCRCPWRASH